MSRGSALGAVTIVNATATGRGCSLAIDAPTHADWTWTGSDLSWQGATDDRLARSVLAVARGLCGESRGARADACSPFPPARGLKTSSAAATALLRAALADAGSSLEQDAFDSAAVRAALDAGVSLTGAYDDQVAVSRGGCHVTDNGARRIESSLVLAPWHVAVWVPHSSIDKRDLARVDLAPPRPAVEGALDQALQGDVAGAMTRSGAAYLAAYAAAGIPVTDAPVEAARAAGAMGAGLSGTGPAVAALFDAPADLSAVAGGAWQWHRAVPEGA